MLCRTVGRTVGTRLFTRINSYDSLPERLLRPPPCWPDDFQAAIAGLPPEEQRIIDLLYGPGESSELTYRDIYELLCKELSECEPGNAFLLGYHGPEQRADGLLKEAVRRIVEGCRRRFGSRGATRAEARRTSGFDRQRTPAAHSKRPSSAFCASAAFMPDEVRPFTGGR